MIDYKDELPGPGAYDLSHDIKDATPAIFQFFGSTVDRFPHQRVEDKVGPGSYKIIQ